MLLGDLASDNADLADNITRTVSDLGLAGSIIKVYPLAALGTCNNALGTEDNSVPALIRKSVQAIKYLVFGEFMSGFDPDARKYLIGMMMVMLMFVLMVMMMVMLVFILLIIVIVMMMVMLVLILVIVVMVVMMAALMLIIIVIMMMMLVIMTALFTLMVVMSAFGADSCGLKKFVLKLGLLLHSLQDNISGKLIPGSGNKNSLVIVLADQLNCLVKLLLAAVLCS